MKRIIVCLLACLLLAACQPTPEVDAVRQKNQDAMIEMARGEGTDTVENQNAAEGEKALPTLDYRTMYGIPEHLTEEFPGLSDKVKIVVDADVNVPDQPLPIVRAVPTDFSQERVRDLWNRLVGDRVMYLRQDGESKETIQKSIEFWMQIQSGELVKDMYDPEEAAERIEALKKKYADAPDTLPTEYADGTLVIGEMKDEHGKVVAHRTELQAYESQYGARFNVQNNYDLQETILESDGAICVIKSAAFRYESENGNAFDYLDNNLRNEYPFFYLNADDPIPDAAKDYIQITPAEVYARAEALLKKAGLDGQFAVYEVLLYPYVDPRNDSLSGYSYKVYCTRLVNGVPVCKMQGLQMNLYSMEDMMAPEWIYEQVEIDVDGTDREAIWWWSPIETQEVIQADCHLLPFSEIQSVMESRLPMLLNRRASWESVKSCTASIRRIDLGLWRIREKNTVETGLLVPAYCFYMDLLYEQDFGNQNTTDILIVNAVDGTVIDPWNGY
ncbi:MAG: hypothetical protein IKZ44_07520 [Clostridia bacterium]|nr:hypothetical protein [Clostridia bacterium]